MLYDFLNNHREAIIANCKAKVRNDSESKPTSTLLDEGLPIFYDELIGVLQRTAAADESVIDSRTFHATNRIKAGDAAAHGRESLRLGYSISQVVHSYGSICQAITEFVKSKSFNMKPREFQDLNYSLDCAIAEAVTEFESQQTEKLGKIEVERLGFLMHELKNSLIAATLSYEMITKGKVGNTGATSQVLGLSLDRMKKLMDGVEKEVRLRGKAEASPTQFFLIDLINELVNVSKITGELRQVHLKHDVNPTIQVTTDRGMVFTALLNLVNNAIKFTKTGGTVVVSAKVLAERLLIEVRDECGGLPEGEIEELFTPFTQRSTDKTGMGLGLSLSRRVIELNKGKLTVRNAPPTGCVFTIDLPR